MIYLFIKIIIFSGRAALAVLKPISCSCLPDDRVWSCPNCYGFRPICPITKLHRVRSGPSWTAGPSGFCATLLIICTTHSNPNYKSTLPNLGK